MKMLGSSFFENLQKIKAFNLPLEIERNSWTNGSLSKFNLQNICIFQVTVIFICDSYATRDTTTHDQKKIYLF